MEAIIKKWGNSLGLRLPMHIVKDLNITEGSKVDLFQKNGKIIITAKDVDLDLNQLVMGMSKKGLLEQFEEYPAMSTEEDL